MWVACGHCNRACCVASSADLVVPAEVLIDMSPAEAEPAPPKPQPCGHAPYTGTAHACAAACPDAGRTRRANTSGRACNAQAEPDNSALSPAPVAVAANAASATGTSSASPPPGTAVAAKPRTGTGAAQQRCAVPEQPHAGLPRGEQTTG